MPQKLAHFLSNPLTALASLLSTLSLLVAIVVFVVRIEGHVNVLNAQVNNIKESTAKELEKVSKDIDRLENYVLGIK